MFENINLAPIFFACSPLIAPRSPAYFNDTFDPAFELGTDEHAGWVQAAIANYVEHCGWRDGRRHAADGGGVGGGCDRGAAAIYRDVPRCTAMYRDVPRYVLRCTAMHGYLLRRTCTFVYNLATPRDTTCRRGSLRPRWTGAAHLRGRQSRRFSESPQMNHPPNEPP